jgi:hypothetical protein
MFNRTGISSQCRILFQIITCKIPSPQKSLGRASAPTSPIVLSKSAPFLVGYVSQGNGIPFSGFLCFPGVGRNTDSSRESQCKGRKNKCTRHKNEKQTPVRVCFVLVFVEHTILRLLSPNVETPTQGLFLLIECRNWKG